MNNDLNGINKRILHSIFLAFIGTIGMQGIMAMPSSENILFTNSIFSFFVFCLLGYTLYAVHPISSVSSKRDKAIATAYSLILSIALHFGARLESVENVRFDDISLYLFTILFALSIRPIIITLINKLPILFTNCMDNHSDAESNKPFNYFQIWMIIFIAWLPVFLALYPGAFVYDAQDEYIEVISRTFSTHHPLLHVLSLGGIIHAAEYLGLSANIGIATYVIAQMLIMSAIFAYAIIAFERWGVKKKVLILVLAFYGLFPLFPMYAVCTAKDGLFTSFFFLMTLTLVIYFKGNGDAFFSTKNMLLFVCASVLMMLLRNNGMYAYLVAIPLIALLARKKAKISQLAVLMILSILMAIGINYVLKMATSATDNEHQEMLTVPIQQIARAYTYSKDVFTEDELDTLYEVIPEEYLITYRFRVSDVLKSGFDNEAYEKNPAKYRELWANIGLRKPLIYLNAWLGTSYGYWYPDAINNVYSGNQMFTFQYTDSSYFGFETEEPGIRDSKFELLERFYEKISLSLFQQKVPVVSMLFAPGFVFMLFLLILFIGIRNKSAMQGLLIPTGMLWLTVLLGPTTLVRYVLILWFIIPLYIPLMGTISNENNKADTK